MNSLFSMGLQRSLNLSLQKATQSVGRSLYRLGTGNRVNSPEDGVVAYKHLKDLQGQARGLTQALNNVSDVGVLVEKADSALSEMLQKAYDLRELAQQATDGNLTTDEREALQSEADGLISDMQNLASGTDYNTMNLLDGSFGTKSVQNGLTATSNFSFSLGDARTSTIGKIAIYSGSTSLTSTAIGGSNYLIINNVTIAGSVDDELSTAYADASAAARVTAVNNYSNQTGVYAENAGNYQTLYFSSSGSTFTGTLASGEFQINNVSITGSSLTTQSNLIDAINQATDQTGVIASSSATGQITLQAADGRNIQIVVSNGSTNNFYDALNISNNSTVLTRYSSLSAGGDTTTFGKVRIWSSKQIVVNASASSTLGFASGTYSLVGNTAVQYMDLSSEANADQAVKVLDTTITQISSLAANVGAIHSRLDSNSDKLISDLTNNSSAQEAVAGVDVVQETANVVYQQLLQNSSLSSIIQANVNRVTVAKLLGIE